MDNKYEALFTPWKIGNVEIKNRIVMCPMGGTSLFGWFELTGCKFDKEAAKLFLERAKNNVGLIIPGIAPLRDTFWGKWLWQNIYAFIFGEYGMKNAPPVPGASYVVWLAPGIIPWFFFSEVLNAGTGCLQEYHYLVKKVVFEVENLPIIKLISCFMVHACFLVIMFGLYLISGYSPRISWIQVLYYSFAASMLGLALTYFTSAVQVFFKDMAQIVGICLQFGMWLTPIMYDEAIFTSRAAWLGLLFKLNPFYYIAAGYRDSMLTGSLFFERPTMTLYFWAVTLVLLMLGLKVFKKMRPHFSDVL